MPVFKGGSTEFPYTSIIKAEARGGVTTRCGVTSRCGINGSMKFRVVEQINTIAIGKLLLIARIRELANTTSMHESIILGNNRTKSFHWCYHL